jgi:hypothetical protein
VTRQFSTRDLILAVSRVSAEDAIYRSDAFSAYRVLINSLKGVVSFSNDLQLRR